MSLRYAILGLLSKVPSSGYDVKKHFEGPYRILWNASFGGLYPALKRLAEEGMVKEKIVRQKRRPDKKVYSITPKGVEDLQEWLSRPPDEGIYIKNEFLLKLFHYDFGTPGDLSELFRDRRLALEEENKLFGELPKSPLLKDLMNDYVEMCLDYGTSMNKAEIEWIERSLKKLKTKAASGKKSSK